MSAGGAAVLSGLGFAALALGQVLGALVFGSQSWPGPRWLQLPVIQTITALAIVWAFSGRVTCSVTSKLSGASSVRREQWCAGAVQRAAGGQLDAQTLDCPGADAALGVGDSGHRRVASDFSDLSHCSLVMGRSTMTIPARSLCIAITFVIALRRIFI